MDQTKSAPIPGWSTEISSVGFHKIEIRGYALEEIIKHLTFSEAIYLTIRGELPSKNHARVFDAVLCGIVDHGFFAPTGIAARIVASANPDNVIPGVAAGILTVGSVTVSPQDTAELILEAWKLKEENGLSREETAERVVEDARIKKNRIPGLGHPLHPTGDPRAIALEEVARKNGVWGEKSELYKEIHRIFVQKTGKTLPINIDGMMGCVLTEMGFDSKEMAGIAALSYMPGIIAHAVEEIKEKVRLRAVEGEYKGVPPRKLPQEYLRG
jgi:citryl-CoA lyase